jgi:Glycosyltransferase family 87
LTGTTVGLSVGDPEGSRPSDAALAARAWFSLTPAAAVITVATLFALAIRAYQLAKPGHLLGVGDYDDGADFGSAILLVHGMVPYRDFVTVQPPGITLLMTPAALLSRVVGTAWAIAAARILTVLASAAAVVLGGLVVRHRGIFALVVTCGLIAIYPGGVQAAHTVLLEPWLVLFCLAGIVLAFDGDRPASGGRLTWSGAALGFACAIKLWAAIPAAVLLVIFLARRGQAARYLAGVAAGFVIPVLPFAAMAPGRFYDSVVMAQLVRTSARTPLGYRLQQLTGLTGWHAANNVAVLTAVALVAAVGGTLIASSLATGQPPPVLDWFAVAMAGFVTVAFLVPDDFYYHYSAFFGPFLAMALALPASRLIGDPGEAEKGPQDNGLGSLRRRRRQAPPVWMRHAAVCVAALTIIVLPIAVPQAENSPTPTYAAAVAAVTRVILPGSCVVSDQASLLISANRFVSSVPGCSEMVDGFGTSYALGGRGAQTAGTVPAVAATWLRAFGAAQYVLLTRYNPMRIAWTPALRAYLRGNFVSVNGPWAPLTVYVRIHPG